MAVYKVPDDFKSISDAVSGAASGDTILVQNGVYHESITFSPQKPAIRLIADGRKVILDGEGLLDRAIDIYTSNIEVNGFVIRDYLLSGIRVLPSAPPTLTVGNKLIRNKIYNISNGNGIEVVEAFTTLIWENQITQSRLNGILNNILPVTPFAANSWIVKNEISGNGRHGVLTNSVGGPKIMNTITGNQGDGILDNVGFNLMEGNVLASNGGSGIHETPLIQLFGQNGYAGIVNNRMYENEENGVRLISGQNLVLNSKADRNSLAGILLSEGFNNVQRNKVRDNEKSGLLIEENSSGSLILENVLYKNTPYDIKSRNAGNIYYDNKCGSSKPRGICGKNSIVLRVPEDFLSISAAVESSQAVPGSLIVVGNGFYHETVMVPSSKPGIRIIAVGEKVILDGKGILTEAFLVQGNNVEIQGFHIIRYEQAGVKALAESNGTLSGLKLIGNKVSAIKNGSCFELNKTFGTLLYRNKGARAKQHGVIIQSGAMNTWAVENEFRKNRGSGIIAAETPNVGNIFLRNVLCENKGNGIEDHAGANLILGNICAENKLHGILVAPGKTESIGHSGLIGNKVYSNEGDGIRLQLPANIVADNQISKNKGSGIQVESLFNVIEKNVLIENLSSGAVLSENTKGNLVIRNKLTDNQPFDISSPNGHNDFVQNDCGKSNPPELCK